MRYLLRRDLLAVEHTGAAAADAAHVVERERAHAQAVVLEVEFERVLVRSESVGAFPAHPLQVDEVPREDGLPLST